MRWALAVMGCALSSMSMAADVELFDRNSGQIVSTYRHAGKLYAAGEPGHEYEIRIRNDARDRILAVTTVDGVNVITGQTGAMSQSGYVVDPYETTRVEGWRKSMSHTAAFYFTKLPDSYAARTGRPDNVGVIGIALFREKVTCCRDELERQSANEFSSGTSPDARRSEAPATRSKAESKLGTGHGRTEYSTARYAEFERASTTPFQTVVIYYDSFRNLQAAGIVPRPKAVASRPNPFPGFVPDP